MSRRVLLAVFSILFLLASLPSSAQTAPFVRTIVVGGAGTPLVNGANFFNAVIGIVAPGPANRWLVKLEPGIFDIGVLTLVMRDYVDIEGSGRGVTVISSIQAAGATVTDYATSASYGGAGSTVFAPAGVHAELRELTVENHCTGAAGVGVYLHSHDARLSRVAVAVETPVSAAGIVLGADARLTEVSVLASCTWANGFATGISIQDCSPTLMDVDVATAGAATGLHRGVRAENSNAIFDRLQVAAPADGVSATYAEGVQLGTNTLGPTYRPRIRNSNIEAGATGGSSQAYAIYAAGSPLEPEVRDTVAKASNAAFAAGLVALAGAGCEVDGSRIEGSTQPYVNVGGSLRFGATRLVGPSPFAPNVLCGSSFDGAYNPLNGPC